MRYVVRSVERGMVLAREGGIVRYESVDSAKKAGVMAGETFMVVEDGEICRDVLAGLKTGEGFFFVEMAAKAGAAGAAFPDGCQQARRAVM